MKEAEILGEPGRGGEVGGAAGQPFPVAAVAGAVDRKTRDPLQAELHLGPGRFQEAAGVQGKRDEPERLAAPDRHPDIGHQWPQRRPGLGLPFRAVHRYVVPGRTHPPDQVTQGGLGPACGRHPLSYEGDLHGVNVGGTGVSPVQAQVNRA